MNPDNIFGTIRWNDLVIWMLAFSGVIFVADAIGILPTSWARWLARNRFESTLKALERLGVRLRWDDQRRPSAEILLETLGIKEPSYKRELHNMLMQDTYHGSVGVGTTRHYVSDGFIDVMGSSTDPRRAEAYARVLNTFRINEGITDFDVVATPKAGSPLIGYEFSKFTDKPFVMGCEPKVREQKDVLGVHVTLDFPKELSLKGKRVLLVDDSTTGGSKMTSLAKHLRECGAEVTQALVVFEPKGKNARERLLEDNIRLHSITEGPSGT